MQLLDKCFPISVPKLFIQVLKYFSFFFLFSSFITSNSLLAFLSSLILFQALCCGTILLSRLTLSSTRLTCVPFWRRGRHHALSDLSYTLSGPSKAQPKWLSCKKRVESRHRLTFKLVLVKLLKTPSECQIYEVYLQQLILLSFRLLGGQWLCLKEIWMKLSCLLR